MIPFLLFILGAAAFVALLTTVRQKPNGNNDPIADPIDNLRPIHSDSIHAVGHRPSRHSDDDDDHDDGHAQDVAKYQSAWRSVWFESRAFPRPEGFVMQPDIGRFLVAGTSYHEEDAQNFVRSVVAGQAPRLTIRAEINEATHNPALAIMAGAGLWPDKLIGYMPSALAGQIFLMWNDTLPMALELCGCGYHLTERATYVKCRLLVPPAKVRKTYAVTRD